MPHITKLPLIPIALAVSLAFGVSAHAADIVISEILFNPDGDENAREFVELYNRSSTAVSLDGWTIGDGEADDAIVAANGGMVIRPGGYAVIFDPDYFGADEPFAALPDTVLLLTVADRAIGSRGLSNSTAETVTLADPAGAVISAVTYDLSCPAGHSWECIRPDQAMTAGNFAASREVDGTPGRPNSVTPPAVNPGLDRDDVTLTPPQPVAGESLDIDIAYVNNGTVSLDHVMLTLTLEPGISLGSIMVMENVLPDERSTPRRFTIDETPAGALAVTAVISYPVEWTWTEDDTLRVELDVPVSPSGIFISEVMPAPEDGSPEWMEIVSLNPWPVNLYGWHVGDEAGTVSAAAAKHLFLEPNTFAVVSGVGTADGFGGAVTVVELDGFPSLNNDGDIVRLYDRHGAVLDSVSWEESEHGVTWERFDFGPGAGNGEWGMSVDPAGGTPGSANSLAVAEANSAALSFVPNPFADETRIHCESPFTLSRIRLRIYDRSGRCVATLADGVEASGEYSVAWNGTSDGDTLPAGPYIVLLECLDRRTGRTATAREILVLARRL